VEIVVAGQQDPGTAAVSTATVIDQAAVVVAAGADPGVDAAGGCGRMELLNLCRLAGPGLAAGACRAATAREDPMPLFKPTYTRPVPEGAATFSRLGKRFVKFKARGKWLEGEVLPGGKCRVESSVWHIRYRDAEGVWQRVKGFESEERTREKRDELLREVREGKDPFKDHRNRPLLMHLADYKAFLAAKGNTPKQVRQVANRVERIVEACKFELIGDVSASRVQVCLAELKHAKKPLSAQTRNHYLQAIRQFTAWLVKDRRTGDDRLIGLAGGNVEDDCRRPRRAWSPAEIEKLLQTAQESPTRYGRLTGADRRAVYLLALGSGLRANELGSLSPASFRLDDDPPIVVVEAGYSKHRRKDLQPIPADVAEFFRLYLADKPRGQRLWPGNWHDRAAEMLRTDQDPAGIAYETEEGFADFHSLRHTYITGLGRHVSPKMAQELARHCDGRLTDRYTHLNLRDLGSELAKIPPIVPTSSSAGQDDQQQLRATGTDDARPPPTSANEEPARATCAKLDIEAVTRGRNSHNGAQPGTEKDQGADSPQSVKLQRLVASSHEKTLTGWVPEWSKGAVLKTAVGESPPGVRIPPHPLIPCLVCL